MTDDGEQIFEGTVLHGRSLEPRPGRVIVEHGRIRAIEDTRPTSDRIILPALVNAHTHLGDSIAKEAGAGLDLEALVAPPDGLKHRLLAAADRETLVDAMQRTIKFMQTTGTGAFIDFRENGVDGVAALQSAINTHPLIGLILGRGPPAVLEHADGYGASGAADADFSAERLAAERAGKPFAIHAGEVSAADIDPALALEPHHVVHMVHADRSHLRRLAETDTPVVVCPRSNVSTGVGRPPIRALLEQTTVALGTDNVMLTGPNLFREMEFTAKVFDIPADAVLRMATIAGADLFDAEWGPIEVGRPARLLVLDGGSDNLHGIEDPVRGIVRRAEPTDIETVYLPDLD